MVLTISIKFITSGDNASDIDNNLNDLRSLQKIVSRSDHLEDRVASLVKTTQVEAVKELKEYVRALCLHAEPSNTLILLTLEELAKVARRADLIRWKNCHVTKHNSTPV